MFQVHGDSISVSPSRLATLNRTYACRADFTERARGILNVGYRPSDYPLMGLLTKPQESGSGIISLFNCTFVGVLTATDYNQPSISTTTEEKKITSLGGSGGAFQNGIAPLSGSYLAPIQSQQYVAPKGSVIDEKIPTVEEIIDSEIVITGAKDIFIENDFFQSKAPLFNLTIAQFNQYIKERSFEFLLEPIVLKVRRSYYRRTNFGIVDQIEAQYSLSTNYDA